MRVPLGGPQRPGFTAGDSRGDERTCRAQRLRVLDPHPIPSPLTCVRRRALMTATVEAALVAPGAVAVVGAEFSAHPHAPVILRTHPWLICGGGDIDALLDVFRGFDRIKGTRLKN